MSASDILRMARESARRMRRMDDELELLESRIGGQGTGFGTSIDHNVVLDVNRNVDAYIDASSPYTSEGRERIREYAECKRCVLQAETLIAGAESAIVSVCIGDGLDEATAIRNAHDMCYSLRLYYVEAATMDRMVEMTGFDERANRAMVSAATRCVDRIGVAHMKAAIEFDDRTPAQLRAEYM